MNNFYFELLVGGASRVARLLYALCTQLDETFVQQILGIVTLQSICFHIVQQIIELQTALSASTTRPPEQARRPALEQTVVLDGSAHPADAQPVCARSAAARIRPLCIDVIATEVAQ